MPPPQQAGSYGTPRPVHRGMPGQHIPRHHARRLAAQLSALLHAQSTPPAAAAAAAAAVVEIRAARGESELAELAKLNCYVFGKPSADKVVEWVEAIPAESWLPYCAFVGGRVAATLWVRHYKMVVDGGVVPLGGIAGVGTYPGHRRIGLLRQLLAKAMCGMRAHGECCSALWASQAAIYQRYGYTEVTTACGYAVDSINVRFSDGDGGSAEVVLAPAADDPETVAAVAELYARFIEGRTGYLQRDATVPPTWGLDEQAQVMTATVSICTLHARCLPQRDSRARLAISDLCVSGAAVSALLSPGGREDGRPWLGAPRCARPKRDSRGGVRCTGIWGRNT
eukprot:SAG11_NODE_37_length_21777_cov_4.523711_7_plen_339_part_00